MPNLVSIENFGFSNCYAIKKVFLSKVEKITHASFLGCRSLTDFTAINVK